MISNQVLQNTLEGLREISRTEFCIIDTDGKTLASTYSEFEIQPQDIQAFVESQAASQLVKGYQYFKVCDDYQLEYILVAHGEDEDTYMVGKLAAFQIQSLIVAYKERFDKDSFIKNLLLDNLLLVDIYNRAKKLHIDADVRRVVMILELEQEREHSSMESVKSLFGGKSKDFITAVDEKSIIIVKELEENEGYEEMDKLAQTILDTLGLEKENHTHIAYGTIVSELKEVSRSYKEARMALMRLRPRRKKNGTFSGCAHRRMALRSRSAVPFCSDANILTHCCTFPRGKAAALCCGSTRNACGCLPPGIRRSLRTPTRRRRCKTC